LVQHARNQQDAGGQSGSAASGRRAGWAGPGASDGARFASRSADAIRAEPGDVARGDREYRAERPGEFLRRIRSRPARDGTEQRNAARGASDQRYAAELAAEFSRFA